MGCDRANVARAIRPRVFQMEFRDSQTRREHCRAHDGAIHERSGRRTDRSEAESYL